MGLVSSSNRGSGMLHDIVEGMFDDEEETDDEADPDPAAAEGDAADDGSGD